MVLGPWTRTTIVAPAVRDGGSVEGANCVLTWRGKGDMRLGCRAVLLGDPEECLASLSIACGLVAIIVEPPNTQRAERLIVERA